MKHLACMLLLAVLLAGCASAPVEKGRADLLDFLVDSKTTKQEVLTNLGQPSAKFQNERILTYQLAVTPKTSAYYVVERRSYPSGWPDWRLAKYSLVLVFDEHDVLQKHSQVPVN